MRGGGGVREGASRQNLLKPSLFSLTSCNFCFTYSSTAFCVVRKVAKEAHLVGCFGSNDP